MSFRSGDRLSIARSLRFSPDRRAVPTVYSPRAICRAASVCLAVLAWTGAAGAADRYVDALNGDDLTGTGAVVAPWRTLTKAHSTPLAVGDVVHVAPGVYDAALGESFPITLKSGVRVIGAGMDRTFLNGASSVDLVKAGGGQTWYFLSDMTLRGAATGVHQNGPGGADTFLVLERLAIEECVTAVKISDGPGIYMQVALINCFVRANANGVWVDEAWSGFGGVFAWLYGCTLIDNNIGLRGTNSFGNLPNVSLQHSIVKKNGDDLFATDFNLMAPLHGCSVSEPSFLGMNGNVSVPPGFLNYYGQEPHLRSDTFARDLVGSIAPWPPAPAPGVPAPSWWGLTFEPSFASIADIDGRARLDGQIDAGCDEVEAPFTYVSGRPSVGQSVDLVAMGPTNSAIALYLSLIPAQPFPTPYGPWGLGASFSFLSALPLDGQGHFLASATLPPSASLIGVDLYLQGHSTLPAIVLTPVEWVRVLP